MVESNENRGERLGRRVGLLAFSTILTTFVAVAGAQVLVQGFSPPTAEPRVASCRDGLRALLSSLERARSAPGTEDNERKRLGRFRTALLPEWQWRTGIEGFCASDPFALRGLNALDRLRYAEEQAVRNAAYDLAPSRREVDRMAQALGSSLSSPQGTSDPVVAPHPSSF
jgi:hypothetical protein